MLTYEQLSQGKITRKKLFKSNKQSKKNPAESDRPMDRMGVGVWLKAPSS